MLENNIDNFKYKENSNKLFTNIKFTNQLTLAEINKLNENYTKYGLNIKQVRVDLFGKEKSSENFLKKKRRPERHAKMTLEEFYFKYFCLDFEDKQNKTYPSKISKKESKIMKDKEEIPLESNDDERVDEESLKIIEKHLKDAYDNCQSLEDKERSFDKNVNKNVNYKIKIIDYINKFKKYLPNEDYSFLLNKWKSKNEVNSGNKSDNFLDWKIHNLKGFKSEIILFASINTIKNSQKLNKN